MLKGDDFSVGSLTDRRADRAGLGGERLQRDGGRQNRNSRISRINNCLHFEPITIRKNREARIFAKNRSEGQLTPMRQQRRSGSFSVLGADVVVTGDIVTTDSLQVNGTIHGDVRCGTLHQGASGTVTGSIVADEARLAGLVDGTVTARLLIMRRSTISRAGCGIATSSLKLRSKSRSSSWWRRNVNGDAA